jgi:ABC-2 type transport system permease protein
LSTTDLGWVLLLGLIATQSTAFPSWVKAIAQVFPMYWLGLGMRSALLPDAFASIEIGGTWRPKASLPREAR